MSVSDNFDIFEDVVHPLDDVALTELSTGLSTGNKRKSSTRKQKHNVAVEKTGVTVINLDDAISPAITPPETITGQFPSMEDRPCYQCHPDYWRDADGKEKPPGVWWHGLSKGEDPKPADTWICGEVQVLAIARDKAARSFGQVLHFKNKLGHWQTWNMPTRLLAGRGDELLRELFDMGLAFSYQKRALIPAYISSVNPSKTVWAASQVGWFDDNRSFVLPDSTIGKDSDGVLFQSESNIHQEYSSAGNLSAWRSDVSMLCVGNPVLIFTVSCAFAGALLKVCNIDGIGFHVFGESSRGKTTGLKLAASVWGHWEKYKRSWKATANGLEGAANLFNDGLLTLDEIGDGDSKEISDTLYMLGNGSGKQRANVLGQAKAVKTWRIAVLSNGEKTIEAHLAQKGLTMKAGQLIRFLQIPLFGQYGAFDDLHGFNDGREFADAIVKNAAKSYGVAGRSWLDKLTQDPDTLTACPQYIDDALKRFTDTFGELAPQELRAAKAFALVGIAGELATDYGITGWNKGATIEATLACFAQWRNYRGIGDTEPQQIKDAITAYVEAFGDARFTDIHDDTRLHGERSGYWRDTSNGREWLFTKTGLTQAAKGFDLKQVVSVLKACGWLQLDSEGRANVRANFKSNELDGNRFYIINLHVQKNTGTTGTAGTCSNDAAYSRTQSENETGTTGTDASQLYSDSTRSTQTEKTTGTPETRAVIDSTRCTRSTREKTDNATHTVDRGRI